MNIKKIPLFFLKKKNISLNIINTGDLEKRIGYFFKNQELKVQALTHKSLADAKGNNFHNERLEFLGDAVFDLCVSDMLMEEYPEANEGELSKMRASLVNTKDLAESALKFKLDKNILLSHSEIRDKGQFKPRLLACVLEALVGAVYVDGGYKNAKKLVRLLLGDSIKKGPVNRDYKSLLQEIIQKKFKTVPVYNILETTGPQHDRIFIMEVRLDQKILGTGRGSSKKQATQSAALAALKMIKNSSVSDI